VPTAGETGFGGSIKRLPERRTKAKRSHFRLSISKKERTGGSKMHQQQKIELRNNKVGNEERSKEWTREEGTADVIVGGTNLRPVR